VANLAGKVLWWELFLKFGGINWRERAQEPGNILFQNHTLQGPGTKKERKARKEGTKGTLGPNLSLPINYS